MFVYFWRFSFFLLKELQFLAFFSIIIIFFKLIVKYNKYPQNTEIKNSSTNKPHQIHSNHTLISKVIILFRLGRLDKTNPPPPFLFLSLFNNNLLLLQLHHHNMIILSICPHKVPRFVNNVCSKLLPDGADPRCWVLLLQVGGHTCGDFVHLVLVKGEFLDVCSDYLSYLEF